MGWEWGGDALRTIERDAATGAAGGVGRIQLDGVEAGGVQAHCQDLIGLDTSRGGRGHEHADLVDHGCVCSS